MTIDVHTHIYPRDYIDALAMRTTIPYVDRKADGEHFVIFPDEANRLGATRPMSNAFHDPAEKLGFMDRHGIDRSVISIGNPWLDCFTAPEACRWAVRLNDWLQDACEQQPRFEAFGVLPVQDPERAAGESDRIASLSRLHGVILGTMPAGEHLDNPRFDVMWEALQRNNQLVFLHPHYMVGYEWLTGYGHALPLALGFPFETTAAVSRLILSGVLDRFPGLRIMLAHGGGTLPYLSGRLDACTRVDGVSTRNMQRSIPEYLKMLYYDTVVYSPDVLRLTASITETSHLAFGTDHPFGIADPDRIRAAIETVGATTGQTAAMLGENAAGWIAG